MLSVDDDEGLQTVLKHYLESESYTVLTANSGAQMIDKLVSPPPNIILLDLVLPDADGISLISQIRAQTQAPIIIVSGKCDNTEKIVCLEMGADDYMTKPFEMRELAARIKAVLRRVDAPATDDNHSPAPKDKVAINGFTLDRNQLQLFDENGNSLEITTGEYYLLEALILAPNRVLSREHLFELTRDGSYDSYDRAIDNQIGRLRKKLGEEGADIIKTVRGAGYMYCPPPSS